MVIKRVTFAVILTLFGAVGLSSCFYGGHRPAYYDGYGYGGGYGYYPRPVHRVYVTPPPPPRYYRGNSQKRYYSPPGNGYSRGNGRNYSQGERSRGPR